MNEDNPPISTLGELVDSLLLRARSRDDCRSLPFDTIRVDWAVVRVQDLILARTLGYQAHNLSDFCTRHPWGASSGCDYPSCVAPEHLFPALPPVTAAIAEQMIESDALAERAAELLTDGLTPKQVSDITGLAVPTVSRIRTGELSNEVTGIRREKRSKHMSREQVRDLYKQLYNRGDEPVGAIAQRNGTSKRVCWKIMSGVSYAKYTEDLRNGKA